MRATANAAWPSASSNSWFTSLAAISYVVPINCIASVTATSVVESAFSHKPLDPILLVSDERIEMTDWELHDFAVQIVRNDLRQNHELMSWQSNPGVTPSIWFVENNRPAWVVVKAARYPKRKLLYLLTGKKS